MIGQLYTKMVALKSRDKGPECKCRTHLELVKFYSDEKIIFHPYFTYLRKKHTEYQMRKVINEPDFIFQSHKQFWAKERSEGISDSGLGSASDRKSMKQVGLRKDSIFTEKVGGSEKSL